MTRPENPGHGRGASEEEPPVVIRDKRKFDSDGNRRESGFEADGSAVGGSDGSGRPSGSADASETGPLDPFEPGESDRVVELTKDLQRVTAEYANYRKRVDRDRVVIADVASARVIEKLLPVLDDIERADQHGDLTGAFKSVADKLVTALQSLGLTPFGAAGDPFDPEVHEAVTHGEAEDVSVPTASLIMRKGYKLNDRLVRPAMVGVTDPSAAAPVSVDPADLDLEPGAD